MHVLTVWFYSWSELKSLKEIGLLSVQNVYSVHDVVQILVIRCSNINKLCPCFDTHKQLRELHSRLSSSC